MRVVWLLVITLSCGCAAANSSQWHATPDKWKEPRIYQTPILTEYSDRVSFDHQPTEDHFNVRVISPNNAYWFAERIVHSEMIHYGALRASSASRFPPASYHGAR